MTHRSRTLLLAMAVTLATLAATPEPSTIDTTFAQGDFAATLAAAQSALARDPSDVDANLRAATIALYHNDLDAATRYVTRVADKDPQNAVARRLAAQIAERRADTTDVDPSTLPARIPFVAEDPLPLITVEVNGHAGLFMIDTGGGLTAVDPAFASEAGVTLAAGGTGIFAGGQTAPIQRGTASTVSVGGVTMHDVTVMGIPTRRVPFFGDRHPDGVIGTRFFTHFLTTLDYVNGALILRPRSDSAAFERDAGANSVPMLLVPDHYVFVHGRINDGPEGWLNVDTGLAGGGISPSKPAVADSHVTLDEGHATVGMGGGGEMRIVPFTASVTVGNRRVDGVQGLYTPDGDQYGIFPFAVRGSVSHGFFRKNALTFDFVAMRLVMQ